MKATVVANTSGIYRDKREGRFWIRPVIWGKRTWRRLDSRKVAEAKEESAELLVLHKRAENGIGRSPFTKGKTFGDIADLYLEARCPNGRGETRNEQFIKLETVRVENLKKFYGNIPGDDIKESSLMAYCQARIKRVSRGTGMRTVELDWVTLSAVLAFGKRNGMVNYNYVKRDRPRLRASDPRGSVMQERIKHCREFAVVDGNELHLLAEFFFADRRSQALGWQMLFEAFTGCRTSEALKLRMDARKQDEPGYIQGNHLFIARLKHGVRPYILLNRELRDFLESFLNWHRLTHAGNPWWFPGQTTKGDPMTLRPLGKFSMNQALRRATEALGLPKRTSHALRSFYVTMRRGDGASEAQIAAEIGITSIQLIGEVYGSRPHNWEGLPKLKYWPDNAAPSWHRWKPGVTADLDLDFGGRSKVVAL
jgi:integrase